MFKIESYITPILLSYVDKYVKDFRPADAQVSLWGGGVVLNNLVIKADVLQHEVSLPFTLISGRIHELHIQVPWTKIMSEPIIVTIDTIECVLNLRPPVPTTETTPPDTPSRKTQVVEAPPGYMQALVKRIVSNIVLRVEHLIVKYVEDDIVLSLNVKHLEIHSADANWMPAFADIDPELPLLRRLVLLEDLTLCLDRTDSDGKIRFYQEPLLYRCQLTLRLLTRLVSANTRRALSLSVQLRSSSLAWGVSSDQLALLVRITRERQLGQVAKPPAPPAGVSVAAQATRRPSESSSSSANEPARSESWAEWARSWVPNWSDSEGAAEQPTLPAAPVPLEVVACCDSVALVLKIMESEGGSKKRARGVLELRARYLAVRASLCAPTTMQVCVGARELTLRAHGKCLCGHVDSSKSKGEPIEYIRKCGPRDDGEWEWPEEAFLQTVEEAGEGTGGPRPDAAQLLSPERASDKPRPSRDGKQRAATESDLLWVKLSPVVLLQYTHDRSPPRADVDPHDDTPTDFQFSDWVEVVKLKVFVEPTEVKVCTGLIHRVTAITNTLSELPIARAPDSPKRVLTVEECEALLANTPQRRIEVQCRGLVVRVLPWEHTQPTPAYLDLITSDGLVVITSPLYPLRVCSAASQVPVDCGPLWQSAQLNVSATLTCVHAQLTFPDGPAPRPVARADLHFVMHKLMKPEYFKGRRSVLFSYTARINEFNVCGSSPRLQVAWCIISSLAQQKPSATLVHTSVAKDAMSDEDAVAIDLTVEDVTLKGYRTINVNTHIVQVQTVKATALLHTAGERTQQAWLFSGPDEPVTVTTSPGDMRPYFRVALQWCATHETDSLDYVGVWAEPTAVAVDPLLVAWLAYTPVPKPFVEPQPAPSLSKSISSTQYFMRRRVTPPSSSGRGASRMGSVTDMVHSARATTHGSPSEAERKEAKPPQPPKPAESVWEGEQLLQLHQRLKQLLASLELGTVLVYVTASSVPAVDCATVRDAMERHAASQHRVMVVNLGRISAKCAANSKLWNDIHNDGPTYFTRKPVVGKEVVEEDFFPWKMTLSDACCYTLEVRAAPERLSEHSSGLRSHLKIPCTVMPQIILDMVTTTLTLSVVTKNLQMKVAQPRRERKMFQEDTTTIDEKKVQYFSSGINFKPSTLKEFIRGPEKRESSTKTEKVAQKQPESQPAPAMLTTPTNATGPVVSLGIHLHADTPPLIVRLDHEQVLMAGTTVHCLSHIVALLRRPSPVAAQRASTFKTGSSNPSVVKSVSELDENKTASEDTQSESMGELVSIYESPSAENIRKKMNTFFWFQWVASRATLVVTTPSVKLGFDIDDIITTVDLQVHYNQFKVKVASASVRHYERGNNDEWTAGVLGGRVLEAREPSDSKQDTHFLAVTVTQAQISNLPASWKEELNPKILRTRSHVASSDDMWEIYAKLAPLEAVVRPVILKHAVMIYQELAPRSLCVQEGQGASRPNAFHWPYMYVSAGGLRLLVTGQDAGNTDSEMDDTFVIQIGRLDVSPHPENPICRRALNVGADSGWLTVGGGFEGRQYETYIRDVSVHSAQFEQLASYEDIETKMKGTAGENPAAKWAQGRTKPTLTPLLHSVEVDCIAAPSLYCGATLACGPAVEVNLVSDCALEFSIPQLTLCSELVDQFSRSIQMRTPSELEIEMGGFEVCPYEKILKHASAATAVADESSVVPPTTGTEGVAPLYTTGQPPTSTEGLEGHHPKGPSMDSGAEAASSSSKRFTDEVPKKSVSIATEEITAQSSHLEVFVTMGTIELSLYTLDDGSQTVHELKPPQLSRSGQVQTAKEPVRSPRAPRRPSFGEDDRASLAVASSRSLTENVRVADEGKVNLELPAITPHARRGAGTVPLMHVTLLQPNFYYWKKKSQKTFQASIFNAWVGLGVGQMAGQWHAELLTTARGVPDPMTDIAPALATFKLTTTSGGSYYSSNMSMSTRGSLRVDIERPVMLHLSEERIRRLRGIHALVLSGIQIQPKRPEFTPKDDSPALYALRRSMLINCIECVTVQTTQVAVNGSLGVVGCEALSLQVSALSRPVQLTARVLVTAALVSLGSDDSRQPLLLPCMIGAEVDAMWESWRLIEGGASSRVPTLRLLLDVDRATVELRPEEVAALLAERDLLTRLAADFNQPAPSLRNPQSVETLYNASEPTAPYPSPRPRHSASSIDPADIGEHYYKDDLRSGVFKISTGGQLPMAYQVILHEGAVSWRYPHPRAVTRIMAFPLPDQDIELNCVLEHYNVLLSRWEPHFYFQLPVNEPREIKLYGSPPDIQFSATWRFRVCDSDNETFPPFLFDHKRFAPRPDPLANPTSETIICPDPAPHRPSVSPVTAEQLSGVLRVDSYFAPSQLPRVRAAIRVRVLEIHAHNALPSGKDEAPGLAGYRASQPQQKRHRVLSVVARDSTAHAQYSTAAGARALLHAHLRSDLFDTATCTMEPLVDQTRVQVAPSFPTGGLDNARVRFRTSVLNVALNVPRIRTLQALAADWADAFGLPSASETEEVPKGYSPKSQQEDEATSALEGRVSLWVHNNCAEALRVGQVDTEQILPIAAGAWLAYRWRCPDAPRKIRFALAAPTSDWVWSNSTPFTQGTSKIRLRDSQEMTAAETAGPGSYLTVKVEDRGGRRLMRLTGRVMLANMLRFNLLYKIRVRSPSDKAWKSSFAGDLQAESLGSSLLAAADSDMEFKIRFADQETGWSGDIPLKKCQNENVPWLVKVPSAGEVPYISVWCRVNKAHMDGRILATIWPLYVLRSHLPLDTDVLISRQGGASPPAATAESLQPPPLIQSAPGRGRCSHLLAPGTASARHSLTFQYRNIESPVTRDAVPLYYGVTNSSVFEKRVEVNNIDDVIADIEEWQEHGSRDAASQWPYSAVARHWPDEWKSATLQPRSEVAIRYQPVRIGGGCSLELQLCPVVLLCNASPVPLTLRAHDAAPLCKVDAGTVIAPPNTILTKPFFMSTEVGRETFVSRQLEVWRAEPGPYGAPPPGHVGLDRRAHFAIHCNQKVALLTLYYQIKHDINLLGVSSTYVLLNRLQKDILVSAIVVPEDDDSDASLRPKHFTFLSVPPINDDSLHGSPICRFTLQGRWRSSGDASELRHLLYVSLADAAACVPVRLATSPVRRAIALTDVQGCSWPVVVTQQEDEGRWLVTVAADPCPQLVLLNRTHAHLMLAEPTRGDTGDTTTCVPECEGARWFCVVESMGTVHYSAPSHCARFPPAEEPSAAARELGFLTLANCPEEEDEEPSWCAPVPLAAGVQLVQLPGGATVKLKITPRPHSTLVELRDVDENDISASDIRKRLQGPFPSDTTLRDHARLTDTSTLLERVNAKDKLLRKVYTNHGSVDDRSILMSTECKEERVTKQVTVLEPTHEDELDDDYKSLGSAWEAPAPSSAVTLASRASQSPDGSVAYSDFDDSEWEGRVSWCTVQRCRGVVGGVALSLGGAADESPLVALHVTRLALILLHDQQGTSTSVTIADMQVDNLQHSTGAFDFSVVAATPAGAQPEERWPPLWSMYLERDVFEAKREHANAAITTRHDSWTVAGRSFHELTEVEVSLGPVALYIEDAYVTALASLARTLRRPHPARPPALAAARALARPLRLRSLVVQPLVANLTARTNVRMYIALDQSPLHLGRYELHDMMMSTEQLTHALTVHYLSAAVLGAGWVVGGLELLGAPGALAARVGGATGGVRAVASTAAAALLKSLSACAGSLARNLDLLAGDEEHTRRAAAARRVPPPSLLAGLLAGVSNFAINMLGAVGGLAHHPLVGVAVGETESGAAALRRGLLGAFAKPLSATADLVAFAGHGLLSQAGWDPVPQPRPSPQRASSVACWRRDCVRWWLRLAELRALAGFEVTVDGVPMQLLLTHKFLVLAEPDSERVAEMIDFKFCTLAPFNGPFIELSVNQPRRQNRADSTREEEDEYQISEAAMARVARYTGAAPARAPPSARRLALHVSPPRAPALHATLSSLVHHNDTEHLHLM